MTLTSDLMFDYPEHLVATAPRDDFRAMLVRGQQDPVEATKQDIIELFQSGDVLLVNDTKVCRRRLMSREGLEVLFIEADPENPKSWQVLFPARRLKVGATLEFQGDVTATLVAKGRPQTIEVSRILEESYFDEYGELALPPYIQKARGERLNRAEDKDWYQTAWAEKQGSLAAPTASLHFSEGDIESIRQRGVRVLPLTLHVGLGTFLPVKTDDLDQHEMHFEQVSIPEEVIQAVTEAKSSKARVFALGTTAVRSIEAYAAGHLQRVGATYQGRTNLFLKPGSTFRFVDVVMTNFHQPGSTLLALVGAFAGLDRVKACYRWAIQHDFRLFSYGDFSVWLK